MVESSKLSAAILGLNLPSNHDASAVQFAVGEYSSAQPEKLKRLNMLMLNTVNMSLLNILVLFINPLKIVY